MINISNDSNSNIVHKLLYYFRNNKLNASQKQTIYNIVMSLEDKTEMQKTRFIMYYNLDQFQTEKYSMQKIGNYFKCSASAIRFSILTLRRALINLNDNRIIVLKEVLEQLEKQN